MRHLLAVLTLLSFAALLTAQETPKYELFGGYSYLHNQFFNSSGWEASGTYSFNRWIGLKLDVDGHYGSNSGASSRASDQIHTFTIGPQFSWRVKRGTLFGHTLFGLAYEHQRERLFFAPPSFIAPASFDASRNSFATVIGGGGDWNLGSRLSWRVAQVDYMQTSFFNRQENHLRISTGVVYRFGR